MRVQTGLGPWAPLSRAWAVVWVTVFDAAPCFTIISPMTAGRRWPGMLWDVDYLWAKLDCKIFCLLPPLGMWPHTSVTQTCLCLSLSFSPFQYTLHGPSFMTVNWAHSFLVSLVFSLEQLLIKKCTLVEWSRVYQMSLWWRSHYCRHYLCYKI